MEQPPADAGLGRRRARRWRRRCPRVGDRRAHRVDDAAGAVAAELTLSSAGSPRPPCLAASVVRPTGSGGRGRRGVLELLLGAEQLIEDRLAEILAERDREHGADERDHEQLAGTGARPSAVFSGSRRASEAARSDSLALFRSLLQLLVVEQRRRLLGAGSARVGVAAGLVGLAQVVAQLLVLDQTLDVGRARPRTRCSALSFALLLLAIVCSSRFPGLFPASISVKPRAGPSRPGAAGAQRRRERRGSSAAASACRPSLT